MKLIKPIDITDAKLISNNLPSDGYQEWIAAGPPQLDDTYYNAANIDSTRILLWGLSTETPPAIFDTSDFSVIYAPSGFEDWRGGVFGYGASPVNSTGTEVAFVTNGATRISVFDTSDFSLKRSADVSPSGFSVLATVWGVSFSPDDSTVGIMYQYENPVTVAKLPYLVTYSSSTLTHQQTLELYFTPTGFTPQFSGDYPSGYIGYYSPQGFDWAGNSTIAYGLMSRDDNTLGRGIYTLDVTSSANTPIQKVDETSNLFQYRNFKRCGASTCFAVEIYHSDDSSELRVYDNTFTLVNTPSAKSASYGILKVSWSNQLLVVQTNLSPKCRIFDGTQSYTEIYTYADPFQLLTLNNSYLYKQSPIEYLAQYTSGSVIIGSGDPYSTGDIITKDDQVYESLTDSNTDVPEEGVQATPATWLYLGHTNETRFFDELVNSQSESDISGQISVVIAPGQVVSGLALLNLQSDSIQIVMTDPVDGVVYDSGEFDTIDSSAIDWYTYLFAEYRKISDVVFTDLPAYSDAEIAITITSDTDIAAVGEIVLGLVEEYGDTNYGTSVGILDFSQKTQDEFGNYKIVERNFSKRAEYDITIPSDFSSILQKALARYRATPIVWVGEESMPETIIYGYYRDFDIVLSDFTNSNVSITVEGL